MKKLLFLLTCALFTLQGFAIPASRTAKAIHQPDGTTLTIKLVGDEFYHFNTTADGYTIVKDDSGVFVYAQKSGNKLVPTTVKAHDAAMRTAQEQAFLSTISKYAVDTDGQTSGEARRAKRDAKPRKIKTINYDQFAGLVILVNFNDCKFSMKDPASYYNHMINDEGYTGFTDDNGKFVSCPGSMHDYFSDNSGGKFRPKFDVLGPVDINYSCLFPNGANLLLMSPMISSIMTALDDDVDFSKYDTDYDGSIDMVYFIFAGMPSNYEGNDSRWLWPHQQDLTLTLKNWDLVRVGHYACSTEKSGWADTPESIVVEGIGTMCHEFSHLLGLPDLYDTDYTRSGGESHDPGGWDLMAYGSGYDASRCPAAYTIFERYSLGWANPKVINAEGKYTLNALESSNEGYIIKTPNSKEFFMLENRQPVKWDAQLPGHGMIVARVDSSKVWTNTNINNNPSRNYYELLRAGNSTVGDLPSDPFPGSLNNGMLGKDTEPALVTWDKTANENRIVKINEKGGVVTFNIIKEANLQSLLEDFEKMPATSDLNAKSVEGNFAKWDFTKCNVAAPGNGLATGKNAVAIYTGTAATMSTPVYYDAYQVAFDVANASGLTGTFSLRYSNDGGKTWNKAKSPTGAEKLDVKNDTVRTLYWNVDLSKTQPTLLRINQTNGSSTKPCYVDNLTVYYTGEAGSDAIPGDVNLDGNVDIFDANIVINIMLGADDAANYDGRADLSGDGMVDIRDLNSLLNLILGI